MAEGVASDQEYQQIPSNLEHPAVDASAGRSPYVYFFGNQMRVLAAPVQEEDIYRLSILLGVCGALFIIVGITGIVLPVVFAFAVEQVIAWLLIFGGVTSLVKFCTMCGVAGTFSFLLLGILDLITGIWMLTNPSVGSLALIYVAGGWFFAKGFLKLLTTCHVRSTTPWPVMLVSGIISILLGIVIFSLAPRYGLVLLGVIFGTDFLASGVTLSLFAYTACYNLRREYLLPG